MPMSEIAVSCGSDLRTILMLFCGLVLIHTCAAKHFEKDWLTNSTQLTSRSQRHSPVLNNYKRYSMAGNGKTKPFKYWQCKPKSLKHVIIKLKTVIARYDEKENELKVLFSGVAGLEKSEKIEDLSLKHRQLKDFNCTKFKYPKTLKKWTHKLLLKFHSEVKSFYMYFEQLIHYEKSRFKKKYRSAGERLKILAELKNDLKMLDVELLEIIERKNKRLHFPRQTKSLTLTIIPPRKSQTDLMILQWEIIQRCKVFLKGYRRKLRKVCKCWKHKMNKSLKSFEKKKRKNY